MVSSPTRRAGLALACAAAACLLGPASSVRQDLRQDLRAVGPAASKCPRSAVSSEPDSAGDCECRTNSGARCFEEMPTGKWKRGCMGFGSRSIKYFPVQCDNCRCFRLAEIRDHGSYVVVHNAKRVKILRQGKVVKTIRPMGNRMIHNFSGSLHREFLVIAESSHKSRVEKMVFPTKNEYCGVGMFTSDRLVCSKLGVEGGRDIAGQVIAHLRSTVARAELKRGFGIEFEFVGRSVPEDVKERLSIDAIEASFGRTMLDGLLGVMGHLARRNNNSDFSEMLQGVQELMNSDLDSLKGCFMNSTKSPDIINSTCSGAPDCALTQYCMDCDALDERPLPHKILDKVTAWLPGRRRDLLQGTGCGSSDATICKPRAECQEGWSTGGGACPTPLVKWDWTTDVTVAPLRPEEARAVGAGPLEQEGVGFELVSPPLSGLEGLRSTVEVLTLLNRMGIQAGTSSGMHVHVNVASAKVPGRQLSPRQVANVWVAFVRFQLVIDEMLSPSRPGNHYARRMFIADDWEAEQIEGCEHVDRYHNCARRFFRQIHAYVGRPGGGNITAFCNAALALPGSPEPCHSRYPDQRYYGLNLVPLVRLGTVEFRAHSATHDIERVVRWAQFAVAFVEHFGLGDQAAARPFLDVPVDKGLRELRKAQRAATAGDLFSALEGKISPGTEAFYGARAWEINAPGCGRTQPAS